MWNAHTLTHTKNVKGTLHSCRSVSHPLWEEMCFHHTINSPINSLTDEAPGDEACPHPEQRDSTHSHSFSVTFPNTKSNTVSTVRIGFFADGADRYEQRRLIAQHFSLYQTEPGKRPKVLWLSLCLRACLSIYLNISIYLCIYLSNFPLFYVRM